MTAGATTVLKQSSGSSPVTSSAWKSAGDSRNALPGPIVVASPLTTCRAVPATTSPSS